MSDVQVELVFAKMRAALADKVTNDLESALKADSRTNGAVAAGKSGIKAGSGPVSGKAGTGDGGGDVDMSEAIKAYRESAAASRQKDAKKMPRSL